MFRFTLYKKQTKDSNLLITDLKNLIKEVMAVNIQFIIQHTMRENYYFTLQLSALITVVLV